MTRPKNATIDSASEANRSEGAVAISGRLWISLLSLAAAQFINILDFMIVMPLGPSFLSDLKITPEQFGHMVACYGFAAFVGGMAASGIIDRFERKRAMLFVFGLFTLSTLLCGLTTSFGLLVAARGLTGVFGGIVGSMAMTIVSDLFHESRRGFALGIVAASFSVASVVGVPLGLWIAEAFESVWTPFLCLAGVSALVWLVMLAALPTLKKHMAADRHSYFSTIRQQFGVVSHRIAYLYTVFLVFGTFTVAPYIATYMVTNVGLQKDQVKYIYIFGGTCSFIALPILGRMTDRFGKKLMFLALASFAIVPTIVITNLGAVPFSLAIAATTLYMTLTAGRMVPAQAILASAAVPRLRAGFMSINSAIQHLASGGAASFSAAIVATDTNNAILRYPWVGVVATLAILVSLPIAIWLVRPRLEPES